MSLATAGERERMADDLKQLGLYLMSNLTRNGRATREEAIAHVRDYCLPNTLRAIAKWERFDVEDPPRTGTWGEHAVARARDRRDELQAFLGRYDPASQSKGERSNG